ncbi:hypothetical protein WJX73_005433 [Symbiochloris irregularis]|uniref:F-box domain-containing protein n=1 Tax=Symbiochloris irregularis TaxID=706552 RepID=A0AAW1P782_9CHLO
MTAPCRSERESSTKCQRHSNMGRLPVFVILSLGQELSQTQHGGPVTQRSITSTGLHDALSAYMLRFLATGELAALACTCKDMRDLAYGQDALWRSSAQGHLPANHPSIEGLDRAGVQQLMQRRADACCNLAAGRSGVKLNLAPCYGWKSFQFLDACFGNDNHLVIFSIVQYDWPFGRPLVCFSLVHLDVQTGNKVKQLGPVELGAIHKRVPTEYAAVKRDMKQFFSSCGTLLVVPVEVKRRMHANLHEDDDVSDVGANSNGDASHLESDGGMSGSHPDAGSRQVGCVLIVLDAATLEVKRLIEGPNAAKGAVIVHHQMSADNRLLAIVECSEGSAQFYVTLFHMQCI